MIYLGADHRGFQLKENLKPYLKKLGYQFEDLGNHKFDPNDNYSEFALKVAEKVAQNPDKDRGILFCASGVGVDIVANKVDGVRSSLVFNEKGARASRNDDDANVLSIAAEYLKFSLVKKIVKIWLETPYIKREKYERRLNDIEQIERTN
jgi:RpiB/LacA/LacB family sugar-phosphate isomerase